MGSRCGSCCGGGKGKGRGRGGRGEAAWKDGVRGGGLGHRGGLQGQDRERDSSVYIYLI